LIPTERRTRMRWRKTKARLETCYAKQQLALLILDQGLEMQATQTMTEGTTETRTSPTKRKRKRTSHSLNPADEGGGVLLLVLLLTIPTTKTTSFQTS
jgi:hypothetical protein